MDTDFLTLTREKNRLGSTESLDKNDNLEREKGFFKKSIYKKYQTSKQKNIVKQKKTDREAC